MTNSLPLNSLLTCSTPGLSFTCCLALLLLIAPALSSAQVEPDDRELSRYERTLGFLQQSSPDEQADFAMVALLELAAVYIAEADLARSDAARQEGKGRARLLGWSMAVEQYANQLLQVLEEVQLGAPVMLRSGLQGPATVTVAGLSVILGHPRADQQAAYERRVLADFCSRQDCQWMSVAIEEPEPISMSAARANPHWAFTESGPVCSLDGLEVHFGSTENLAMLRSICDELAQEVSAFASELAWQIRHGVQPDWRAVTISPTPGRPEHLVRLNSAGDSSLLTVPLLFSSPALLADIQPWLEARIRGDKPVPTRLDAAEYGWVPPSP